VFFAVLLRVWVSLHIYVVANDAAGGYLYQAREMLRGNWTAGFGTYFPPGYPLVISAVALLTGDVEMAGRLISILCGGALILVVLLLFVALGFALCILRASEHTGPPLYRMMGPGLAAVLMGFALLAAPYVTFLRWQIGTWTLSGKTMENLISYDISPQGVPVD